MKRSLRLLFASLAVLTCLAVDSASAQAPYSQTQPYRPPAVSPYTGFLRRGGLPAVNYYNVVRPQFEFNRAVQGLQQQVTTAQQDITQLESPSEVRATGFRAQFQNHTRFFMNHFSGQSPSANRPSIAPPSQRAPARGGSGGARSR